MVADEAKYHGSVPAKPRPTPMSRVTILFDLSSALVDRTICLISLTQTTLLTLACRQAWGLAPGGCSARIRPRPHQLPKTFIVYCPSAPGVHGIQRHQTVCRYLPDGPRPLHSGACSQLGRLRCTCQSVATPGLHVLPADLAHTGQTERGLRARNPPWVRAVAVWWVPTYFRLRPLGRLRSKAL